MNELLMLGQTITVSGLEESGISAILTMFSLMGLIFMVLLKFLNVVKLGDFYEMAWSYVTLFIGSVCYMFVFVGFAINTVYTFAIYLSIATLMYLLLWIFFIAEVIIWPAKMASGGRKETRFSR